MKFSIVKSNIYIEKENMLSKRYDVVIMTEVFEHFRVSPIEMMKKIGDALAENGRIFFSTPNWGHLYLYENWRELKNSNAYELEELIDDTVEYRHVYQYSEAELRDIFSQVGLVVEKYALSATGNHNFMLYKG